MVGKLKRPRRVMLLVKAGDAVDAFIDSLVPLLEKGDIIIDGGNSNYFDTNVRKISQFAPFILAHVCSVEASRWLQKASIT